MNENFYTLTLNENSKIYDQPINITTKLKPHQLAALYKIKEMEQNEFIYYKSDINNEDYYEIRTNIGIIGDKVGYGKTLIALSLIAELKLKNIFINDKSIKTYNINFNNNDNNDSNNMIIKHINSKIENISNNYINTTLIIVPRGPVYNQWKTSIKKQSKLNILEIDDLRKIKTLTKIKDNNEEIIKKYFEKYDGILIKNTTLKKLLIYYYNFNLILKWSRIIVDEAHDILNSISNLSYLYLWLISASYTQLLNIKSGTTNSLNLIKNLLKNELDYVIVKSNINFIKKSFELPKINEIVYKCKISLKLDVIRPYLSKSLIEKLDASDLHGMIKEMGGKVISENNIIDIFTTNLKKDIHNKKCDLEHILKIDIDENERKNKKEIISKNIKILEDRLYELTERLSYINEKKCSICLDNINNPIYLECSHTFCSKCLIIWHKRNNTCPECREEIKFSGTILPSLDNDNNDDNNKLKSKENTLINIIKQKKEGKFLIFSKIENGFTNIKNILSENNISYNEIKGNTGCMNNILKNFKEGNLNVILLNTHYAGSGIDISFATDVIIYHAMRNYKNQAIGRAYRVGRELPLTVHTLLYEHEIE